MTRALVSAGQLLGLPMLDHVIVTASEREFYSFADAGKLDGIAGLAMNDGDAVAYVGADLADCETRLDAAERSLAALNSMHDIRTARVDAFGGETMGTTAEGYSPAFVLGLDPNSEADVRTARERIGALRTDHAAALRAVKDCKRERRAIVAEIARKTGRAPVGWARVAGSHEFEPIHTMQGTAIHSAAFEHAAPVIAAPVRPVVVAEYVPELPPIEAYADVDAAPVRAPVAAVMAPRVFAAKSVVAEPVAARTMAPFVLAPRRPGGSRVWRFAVTMARGYWRAVAAAVEWIETDRDAAPAGAVFTFRGLAMADGDAPDYRTRTNEPGAAADAIYGPGRERAARIVAAVNSLLAMDQTCWLDTATQFTCTEADGLAEVFRAAGHDELAEGFIARHADADEDGDSAEHLAIAAAEELDAHG